MSRKVQIDAVLQEKGLENFGAVLADASRRVPRSVSGNDNPRGLGSVHVGKIVRQPVDLLVHEAEGTSVFCASHWLIRANQAVAKISFRVNLNEMDHATVIREPKVFIASRLIAWHTEVVPESSEVHLARHTDLGAIRPVAAIVTISFMVSRTNHVWLDGSDNCQLVVELVKD